MLAKYLGVVLFVQPTSASCRARPTAAATTGTTATTTKAATVGIVANY